MLPAQILAAAVVPVFPLHAVIDCGPLALRAGTPYWFKITVESATGKKAWNNVEAGSGATAKDTATAIFSCLPDEMAKRQDGVLVTLTELDGAPVRKVTFEFKGGGPKPIVRWLPKGKK